MLLNTAFSLFLSILMVGCASLSPADVAKPSDITLESALKSVGQGLNDMYVAQKGLKTGLIPTEVTVTFNLSVSASDSKTLALDFTKAASKVGINSEQAAEADRSNSVIVKFVNILVLPTDSLLQKKSSEDIGKILQVLEREGIKTFQVLPN